MFLSLNILWMFKVFVCAKIASSKVSTMSILDLFLELQYDAYF
jgi:hypothetical protein